MVAKQKQLLLELTVLRARYSLADIKRVARADDVRADPALHLLASSLADIPPVRRAKPPSNNGSRRDSQTVVRGFIDRIVNRKILRAQDQLEDFCRALGVEDGVTDRKNAGLAIREVLETLPKDRVTAIIDSARMRRAPDAPGMNARV